MSETMPQGLPNLIQMPQGVLDFGLISKLMPFVGDIKAIIDASQSNGEIADKIKQAAPHLVNILEGIGGALYPGLAPALRIVAGALATYDQDGSKWLQGALNQFLGTNLVVDGEIGPATIAAVKQAQEKLGIDPDGFAGKVTYAALRKALEIGT